MTKGWEFWIDRGGTFTDIVAKCPDGKILIHKLLSENPEQYQDAPVEGMRHLLGLGSDVPIPMTDIAMIKMGTTVATNALLERKGEPTVLVITKGFGDALRIAYQNRPDLFAREIILPEMLYQSVIEVEERYDAQGREILAVNREQVKKDLTLAYLQGIRACAIVFMHGYRYPQHEIIVEAIARELNFSQISVSHSVSPLIKLITRGDTTVVDAYLSPILQRYVAQVASQLQGNLEGKLLFMQSNGGLIDAPNFKGKDSILSGPAGGIVGAVKTSLLAGFRQIVTFDMGGTSTDVAHYAGDYERSLETLVAGVRLCSPMMSIHTVAAGGGSLITFDGSRYRVGPASAGANPGPAAYGRDGPLTITDCNVLVGKLQPEFFPQIFGKQGNSPLDVGVVRKKFTELTELIGDNRTIEAVASGFSAIAVEKMANAIKKISLLKGYDLSKYTLCCFGGAGGQHACMIADSLGIKQILIHPYAGVLSAYGIGLADIRVLREKTILLPLAEASLPQLNRVWEELLQDEQGREGVQEILYKVHLKYQGTDSALVINFTTIEEIREQFLAEYQQRYGFTIPDKPLIVEAVSVELICPTQTLTEFEFTPTVTESPRRVVPVYTANRWYDTPVYQRNELKPGDILVGPVLIIEPTGTNMVEPGWQAQISDRSDLILTRYEAFPSLTLLSDSNHAQADPILLEIFNNLFRAVAEQMGTTLQNTSYSVNIKERLDFSCAIFDAQGQLVANAPHIPVHLGSMSDSVVSLIDSSHHQIEPGDVYLLNNPYNGGTHLPDLTLITPVFLNSPQPLFYVASRGHHADIGGITPSSMPPQSTRIEEEGVLIDHFPVVKRGIWQQEALSILLTHHPYPVRNLQQNLADLQAQIAANQKGAQELSKMVDSYGLNTVQAYMHHVQENAAECVREAIAHLQDGSFSCELDSGAKIQVQIKIDHAARQAKIDFTGTSPQLTSNFNAPSAVCKAAVLYVFRTLVSDDIPLNSGCLKPLDILIPPGSLLDPQYPAAVVAGNVETSQIITDCLYGALQAMAGSQGTMNNFTFGNADYQYYETICGGSGAGPNFAGTDAVQTHMTNSRITDPEVLEWRFPVRVESFSIRKGSGGLGLYSGGNGVIRRLRFLVPMTAGILSNRRLVAPFGLNGGNPGLVGRNYLERGDGTVEELGGTATVELRSGDIFVIETPGGGGFNE
ncbi:hydantoinase B/oxoprolinase family protein [Gloeocapsa sp. PCC 73106]|uniref:hydantoinase B/oxoprolinase family protein n=1 Tax=Gloeocapsa sp. PCC 73106 TaxID=102232 RepID=UPI0002ACA40E|nr:hydantoinase B/oxoprolinase family protein [Gloeocapsa sp. PCC 73106]ELR98473.1 N-methylhydantoinase B/acetone carboxylase, alpha subunit [Gloeocapsa sp. PCC 73106]